MSMTRHGRDPSGPGSDPSGEAAHAASSQGDCDPSRAELYDFARRACASRLQGRLDAMDERGLDHVGISKGFAQELVRALTGPITDAEEAAFAEMEAVSARVQQGWDADESVFDDARLNFLEKQARASRTGISFDFVPSAEGEPSGFRFMRRFFIGEPCRTIRAAIDRAIVEAPQHKTDLDASADRTLTLRSLRIGDRVRVKVSQAKPWTFDWQNPSGYEVGGLMLDINDRPNVTLIDDGDAGSDGFHPEDLERVASGIEACKAEPSGSVHESPSRRGRLEDGDTP